MTDALQTRLMGAMRSPGHGADIAATSPGGFARLAPLTERATRWLRDAVDDEASWDGDALVVERRYFDDIAEAAIAAGLTFERDDTLN